MTRLIEIEKGSVSQNVPERSFRMKHNLVGHPLFTLERLAKLAASLPSEKVEFNGPVTPGQDPKLTPSNGLSAEDTVHRIEECKSWMVIKNAEEDPEYKALLDACLDDVEKQTHGLMGEARNRAAFIFVTSPGNVTPLHADPEFGILMQLRGSKRMSLFDRKDNEIVSSENQELYPGKHRNLPYKESFEARALHQHLAPGEACFVPIFDPHWVQNGDEVSISLSVTWHTAESERQVKLSYVNAGLRKLGYPQAPAGTNRVLDGIKIAAYDVARPLYDFMKRILGGRRKAVALIFGKQAAEAL